MGIVIKYDGFNMFEFFMIVGQVGFLFYLKENNVYFVGK